MSEFSESYHLAGEDRQEGVDLLRRASVEGFVFPPENGWIKIVPRSEFGQPIPPLIDANRGDLLQYLFDEDGGWMFALYEGAELASHYSCVWLDWSDPTHAIVSDSERVDLEHTLRVAQRHTAATYEEIDRIVNPKIVRKGEGPGSYEVFADWLRPETSPAYAFAELMGLTDYEWLRWRDDLRDAARWESNGAVHVEIGERSKP